MRKAISLLLALTWFSSASAEDGEWQYLFKDASVKDFYFDFIEETKPEDVFKFKEDGILLIEGKGKPIGYLQTLDEFTSYEIETEWRWPDEPGNGGIQLHSSSIPYYSIWPECIEVQMEAKNVGDFWLLGSKIEVEKKQMPQKSSERDRRLKLVDAEKKKGEWNKMRIVVKEKEISVFLNDKLVNKGTDPSFTSGYITIQAEESNLEFRNFRLRELDEA